MSNKKSYEYDAVLHEMEDNGGAYVAFPWDIRREFGKGLSYQGLQLFDLVGIVVRPLVQQGQAQVRHDAGSDGIVLDAVEGCIPGGVEQVGCEGVRDDDLGSSVPQVEQHVLHDILCVGEPDEQGCICLQGSVVTQVKDAISLLVASIPDLSEQGDILSRVLHVATKI